MEKKVPLSLFYGLIYTLEGILTTYFIIFNILYLRSFEKSFTEIGLINAVIIIPFIIKIFVGLFSDGVNLFGMGHRKPLVVIGIIMEAAAIFAIPFISPVTHMPVFIVVLFLAALGMSIFDTATDGYCIDITPEDHRGYVQGLMVGGRAVGAVLAGVAIGFIAHNLGWPWVFYVIGIFSLLPLIFVFIVPPEVERTTDIEFDKSAFRSFLKLPVIMFMILGFVYPLVVYSVESVVGAFVKEGISMNLGNVGIITSLIGVGMAGGALAGSGLIDRLGHGKSVYIALISTSVIVAALAAINAPIWAYILTVAFGFAFGYYEAVYFTLGMDFADPRIAATMFAIFMALGNFGIGLGQPIAGALMDNVGFRWTFIAFALINLIALPLIPFIFKKRPAAA
jgi:PAT family beta-lactamase induction signal transducer AmpG